MLPHQLTPESFNEYPPEARRLAAGQIALLQRLPLGFVPLLLRELIIFDWKFPAERKEVERQFDYLAKLSPEDSRGAMAAFAELRLPQTLERTDWVNSPATFSEQLSAHLWATHQIDAFRAAATDYVQKSSAASPDEPLPAHRLGIVVIGQGVATREYRLFQKLSRHGVRFTHVQYQNGLTTLLQTVSKRAAAHPALYSHWYIDGGSSAQVQENVVARISYSALSNARAALQNRMQKAYESSAFDPEALRTMLARMRPEDIGLAPGVDPVLNRFQLSLLTEASGTQVFATTFVQWTAREALRRAQPLTLLAHFTPRQREKPMNELLAEAQRKPELDPEGSLVDADMGAYYTWINQQRLSGADKAAFLVWFEDHPEAVAIAPGLGRGERQDSPIQLADLVARIA